MRIDCSRSAQFLRRAPTIPLPTLGADAPKSRQEILPATVASAQSVRSYIPRDVAESDMNLRYARDKKVLSVVGMGFAATGYLDPVSGAITQEVIDVLVVLNALRAAFPRG